MVNFDVFIFTSIFLTVNLLKFIKERVVFSIVIFLQFSTIFPPNDSCNNETCQSPRYKFSTMSSSRCSNVGLTTL